MDKQFWLEYDFEEDDPKACEELLGPDDEDEIHWDTLHDSSIYHEGESSPRLEDYDEETLAVMDLLDQTDFTVPEEEEDWDDEEEDLFQGLEPVEWEGLSSHQLEELAKSISEQVIWNMGAILCGVLPTQNLEEA